MPRDQLELCFKPTNKLSLVSAGGEDTEGSAGREEALPASSRTGSCPRCWRRICSTPCERSMGSPVSTALSRRRYFLLPEILGFTTSGSTAPVLTPCARRLMLSSTGLQQLASTKAYVAGTQEGLLLEKPLQMGETLRLGYHLDIAAELRLVEKVKTGLKAANSSAKDELTALKELGFKRASHFGWPNVYAFTKALGEMLLEQHMEDLPVVIVRPTMVTSTYRDPIPGWIEGARTIDAMIVAYDKQSFPCFIGDRKDVLDVVPADMVVNATLVAMAVHWNEKTRTIYHVSSSLRNPLTGYLVEDACWDYFSIHPRVLESGKPLQNKRPYFKRYACFRAYLILMYKLPLEILHAVSLLFCGLFAQYYNRNNRRYTFLMLLVKLYVPFAFFKGRFDDTNLTRLRMEVKMDGKDGNIFDFDTKSIDWHSYFLSVHVPAVLKYERKRKRSM